MRIHIPAALRTGTQVTQVEFPNTGCGATVSGMKRASHKKSNRPLTKSAAIPAMTVEERHGMCSTLRILLMDACMYLEENHLEKSMDKIQAARKLAQELFMDSIPPDEARKREERRRVAPSPVGNPSARHTRTRP